MITFKISKDIKIQEYLIKGLKFTIHINDKWIIIKLNEHQVELLKYLIDSINNNER